MYIADSFKEVNSTQNCHYTLNALSYKFALRSLPVRAPNMDVWNALDWAPTAAPYDAV